MPSDSIPQTVTTGDALFREEAARARRYSAAVTDKKVIEQLNQIAMLYDGLATGQHSAPTDRD